jgi:glycosyltransferase involved in cell wall biosynthesis
LAAGGAERVVLAVAGEIAGRGYRCDIVTAQSGGIWEEAVPQGVRHISLQEKKPLHAVLPLVRYLHRERPTALLSSVFAANIAALLACMAARVPVRCVVREAYRAAEEVSAGSIATTLANKLALRLLYRRADAVVALSDALAMHISLTAHVPRGRIHVICNPLLPGAMRRRSKQSNPTASIPLVLACGRLEPQKDFATLLRAFAIVHARVPARLVILGQGSQKVLLSTLADQLGIADAVEFAGHASDPHAWMEQARVFVSTSRCEGFPNVLMEALDSGCAVVSTESSDTVAEILDGGRLGTIVDVGDIAAVAKGILNIIDGRTTYPPAHDHLRQYDLSAIASKYFHVMTATTTSEHPIGSPA